MVEPVRRWKEKRGIKIDEEESDPGKYTEQGRWRREGEARRKDRDDANRE